jgi:hypothetical protein
MERINPRTLSGFMELLPDRQAQMDRMMKTLRESYALYGFAALDTPVIEAAEVLLAKGGGETEKQIYRFTKGDSDLALRFDLTVPLAKYVAAYYGQLSFPFRRFQIGKVLPGGAGPAGPLPRVLQADIRRHRRRRARHHERGGDPRRHLPQFHGAGPPPLPHPGEQPQGFKRFFRHAGAFRAERRGTARRRQAR